MVYKYIRYSSPARGGTARSTRARTSFSCGCGACIATAAQPPAAERGDNQLPEGVPAATAEPAWARLLQLLRMAREAGCDEEALFLPLLDLPVGGPAHPFLRGRARGQGHPPAPLGPLAAWAEEQAAGWPEQKLRPLMVDPGWRRRVSDAQEVPLLALHPLHCPLVRRPDGGRRS